MFSWIMMERKVGVVLKSIVFFFFLCIFLFKITHNICNTTVSPDLSFNERTKTRGNNYKLHNRSFHYDLWMHFFSARIVNIWNTLPNAWFSPLHCHYSGAVLPLPSCHCRRSYIHFCCRFGNMRRNWMETTFCSNERNMLQEIWLRRI